MIETIKIKKGLDIPLGGRAEGVVVDALSIARYAVEPPAIVGFTPRLLVAEGDAVCAGQPLAADKKDPRLTLPSPVDGVVEAIVRGEKRRVEAIVVDGGEGGSGGAASYAKGRKGELSPSAPVWWMLRERPFGTIANPDHKPKGIYISLRDTNPLAPDIDYALQGREDEFAAGVRALEAYAPVHCVKAEGPHPAGNIGTIVGALDPINKGECIWYVGAQDVANIGRWVTTGEYRPERVISAAGPAAKAPKHYRLIAGACIKQIADTQLMNRDYPALTTSIGTRIVSGSVLSGTTTADDGFLGPYDQQLTFIEEGDQHEFMGWLMPGLDKFSFSKTFLSGFMREAAGREAAVPLLTPKGDNLSLHTFHFDTNLHGGRRPLMFTGNFERVFPLDIYPMQLIKACIVGDIELQEKLGIYEVEPEDFALCEFVDPSKTEIQTTIREALEVLRKEATA